MSLSWPALSNENLMLLLNKVFNLCFYFIISGKIETKTDESQLLTASNFAVSSSWTVSARLATGSTLLCMSKYDKSEFIGHILKYKVSVFVRERKN